MTTHEDQARARTEAARIEACIVNHNTSEFAELAVRTMAATHVESLGSGRLNVTLVDNHSNDHGLADLKAACGELGVGFCQSAWPAADAPVNTHGDVLRDFVGEHEAATHFLFVDTDVYFATHDTVGTMLTEVANQPDVWAMQARFAWAEEYRGRGSSLVTEAGPTQQLTFCIDGASVGPFSGPYKPRCHPALALVPNTPIFRNVADIIGLSAALIIAADPATGGFADTFALASLVMQTHNLRHAVSEVTVGHYYGVSYEDSNQPVEGKIADCRRRLAELRTA
jgi:hypothetical protein